MEFTESSPSDRKSFPANSVSGQKSAGVLAPVLDQWSTKTPEKPINPPLNVQKRSARSLVSLKDVREAAQKLLKPVPTRRELLYDQLLSSDEKKCSSVSESPVAEQKKRVNSVILPEKYEMLERFFNSMDSSIRLLNLKGSATTFTNISAKVENLTDKRFSYSHLAQLKFILPEAIEIQKILKHDERTCCMKPDLYITLNANAVDGSEKWIFNTRSVLLRKVFRSRLLDFFKSHPGGDDIPEETLPGPLSQSKQAVTNSSRPSVSSLTNETPDGAFLLQSVAASHLSGSFRRCFSKQASITGGNAEQDRAGLVPVSPSSIPLKVESSTKKKPVACADAPKLCSKQTNMKYSSGGIVSASSPPCHPPAPPMIEAKKGENGSMSAPATPMLEPPKRCYMSPDDDPAESPMKLARHSSTRRSLFFDTPAQNVNAADQVCESEKFPTDDIFDILPENLLKSIGEKESKELEEQDPAISQAKRHKQMIACLPRLFDMIYFLFQSIKRSVMTKEELMHRLISRQTELADKREIEEQLILLQKLAPEWIYEKPTSSGILLLCVNKISNPATIRSRLAEAK
ncbi:PREDICTED: CDT1-like protein a, chloroplastic isoform X2 [Nicotiana attenuata]|uniref:CDT1-like protein a, chloroplastic isoform X2 n=1 Tax=Nicotiana attenuata TaxID=49451 RepID=UPI000905CA06|nr:PREDICTED: CDT1-like protein a, chloroplastic isoform X2 [Nicotiana attenuata]